MPSMLPADHHRDGLACPPSRATHERWWRPSGEPDFIASDLPQSGALCGIERGEAAPSKGRLLRPELHAWEHARAVLRGGDGSNVVSLPDYLKDYETPREATQQLGRFFVRYNEQRQHQSLDYQTPAAVYFGTGVTQNIPS